LGLGPLAVPLAACGSGAAPSESEDSDLEKHKNEDLQCT
jgi:hypothetical protein